jgi:hypothetical protein
MSGKTNAEKAVYGSISDRPPKSIRCDVEVEIEGVKSPTGSVLIKDPTRSSFGDDSVTGREIRSWAKGIEAH